MTLKEFLDEIGINELTITRSTQFRGREIFILDRGYNFEVYDIDDYLIATYDKGTRLFEYHGDKHPYGNIDN